MPPKTAAEASADGKAHHIPVSPAAPESRYAAGIIIIKPLIREIICAGRACPDEAKYMEIMILNPANGQPVK